LFLSLKFKNLVCINVIFIHVYTELWHGEGGCKSITQCKKTTTPKLLKIDVFPFHFGENIISLIFEHKISGENIMKTTIGNFS